MASYKIVSNKTDDGNRIHFWPSWCGGALTIPERAHCCAYGVGVQFIVYDQDSKDDIKKIQAALALERLLFAMVGVTIPDCAQTNWFDIAESASDDSRSA